MYIHKKKVLVLRCKNYANTPINMINTVKGDKECMNYARLINTHDDVIDGGRTPGWEQR